MLSVCIPVFNSDIERLIKALYFQKAKLKYIVEIIVIDDASDIYYKEKNRKLGKYIDQYIELDENIGRARIRNLFLQYAEKPNLLFIDSDSIIDNSGFLGLYIKTLKSNEKHVIIGGSVYSKNRPQQDKILRWKYGRKVESKPSKIRSKNSYKSFITKNVIIPKDILQQISFHESITGYGHEDTLMGYDLKKAKVKIIHIDNGVVNEDLDTNEEFLYKSREAVKSLFKVLDIVNGNVDFILDVKLLVFVQRLYKMHLHKIVFAILRLFLPLLKFFLLKIYPDLMLFNLYKLYYALKCSIKTDAGKYFF